MSGKPNEKRAIFHSLDLLYCQISLLSLPWERERELERDEGERAIGREHGLKSDVKMERYRDVISNNEFDVKNDEQEVASETV